MSTRTEVRLESQITWIVRKSREGKWVGVCAPLSLSMEGDTLDELHASIDETLQLMLTDLLVSGELESFLRSHGWQMQVESLLRAGVKNPHFDVPIELLVQSRSDSARSTVQ